MQSAVRLSDGGGDGRWRCSWVDRPSILDHPLFFPRAPAAQLQLVERLAARG